MTANLASYQYLVTHIVPGPRSLSYFVPLLLLPIALSIPPSVASKQLLCATFLPIITASVLHAWIAMGCVDVISVDIILHSCYLLLFNDPRRDFRRVISSEGTKKAVDKGRKVVANGHSKGDEPILTYIEQPYPTKLSERLPWVCTLLISIRFVDWKIGVPSHDAKQPAKPSSRGHLRFILIAIMRTLAGYLVMDFTSAWTQQDAFFKTAGMSIDSPLPGSKFSVPLPPRLLRTAVMALQAWATVGQQVQLPCAVPVALHWAGWLSDTWSPHLWPPYFGSFTGVFMGPDLSAIRLFWGRYWHQTLRYYCSGPGFWIADLMGLSRRGYTRYFLLAAATFFFSGIVHIGLVPPQPIYSTISANQIRWIVAGFFWTQPLGFVAEMFASAILRRLRLPRLMFVLLNIAWFTMWCCIVLPPLSEAGKQLGYWRAWPVPLSLWQRIRLGHWSAWS